MAQEGSNNQTTIKQGRKRTQTRRTLHENGKGYFNPFTSFLSTICRFICLNFVEASIVKFCIDNLPICRSMHRFEFRELRDGGKPSPSQSRASSCSAFVLGARAPLAPRLKARLLTARRCCPIRMLSHANSMQRGQPSVQQRALLVLELVLLIIIFIPQVHTNTIDAWICDMHPRVKALHVRCIYRRPHRTEALPAVLSHHFM